MHVIWHTVLPGHFYHKFENKDTILRVEGVSDLAYEFCYCVYIALNRILKKPVHLVQLHCDFCLVISNDWEFSSTEIFIIVVYFVCGLDTDLV